MGQIQKKKIVDHINNKLTMLYAHINIDISGGVSLIRVIGLFYLMIGLVVSKSDISDF